jgi:hypothetical protein
VKAHRLSNGRRLCGARARRAKSGRDRYQGKEFAEPVHILSLRVKLAGNRSWATLLKTFEWFYLHSRPNMIVCNVLAQANGLLFDILQKGKGGGRMKAELKSVAPN